MAARCICICLLTCSAAGALGDRGKATVVDIGGGHGELGYHLSQQLADKYGLKVTMVHDGGPDAKVRGAAERR